MRPAPANYAKLLASPILRPTWEVTSFLGSTYLGKVPVKSGTLSETSSDSVPGVLTLTVPNQAQWRAATPTSPLGWWGQRLTVRTGLKNSLGQVVVWFNLGQYRTRKPTISGDVLQVRADSLHQLVLLARFASPTALPAQGFKARVSQMLRGILPVTFDPALTDRPAKAVTYERERLDALVETLTAWPAQLELLPNGVAYITTPWESRSTVPVATYTDGDGGTLLDANAEVSSDDADVPNAVIASNEPDDGSVPFYEAAYTTGGPLRWGGTYGFVPAFFSSPLLTTRAQCLAAARTRLASLQRPVQQIRLSMVEDPRLQLGDVVRGISSRRSTDVVGRVLTCNHGLTPAEKIVDVTLSVLSGTIDGQAVG